MYNCTCFPFGNTDTCFYAKYNNALCYFYLWFLTVVMIVDKRKPEQQWWYKCAFLFIKHEMNASNLFIGKMKSVLASLIKLNRFHICVYLKYHALLLWEMEYTVHYVHLLNVHLWYCLFERFHLFYFFPIPSTALLVDLLSSECRLSIWNHSFQWLFS